MLREKCRGKNAEGKNAKGKNAEGKKCRVSVATLESLNDILPNFNVFCSNHKNK